MEHHTCDVLHVEEGHSEEQDNGGVQSHAEAWEESFGEQPHAEPPLHHRLFHRPLQPQPRHLHLPTRLRVQLQQQPRRPLPRPQKPPLLQTLPTTPRRFHPLRRSEGSRNPQQRRH